jgi:glyoxylase-like metal-dependent hydrolase (beta-lactamase superfamily II)
MVLGDYRIEIVAEAEFRLDGGAMFGVVPRPLWERVAAPDERNRIRLKTNCLFIETSTERILIETGIGDKWSAKEKDIYAIRRAKSFAETLFEKTGYTPEQISIVVNTHLHFDHAGGNTSLSNAENALDEKISAQSTIQNQQSATQNLKPQPTFPNARYFVSESELKHAENPTERDRGSYVTEDWRALRENGQLETKAASYEVVDGLTMLETRGHNATMQTFCLRRGDLTLYGFADLIPTTAHLPLAWIMGYDLFPLDTLSHKKRLLPMAVRENWLCFFYHETQTPLCRLREENGRITTVPENFQ